MIGYVPGLSEYFYDCNWFWLIWLLSIIGLILTRLRIGKRNKL
jgi:hypothetical protein